MPDTSESVSWATSLQEGLGGIRLTQPLAKLYSQYTRLTSGRRSLAGWMRGEEDARLRDAERLVSAALALKENGHDAWQQPMRRAAEILEWLSHPELNPRKLPIRLLSAAAYQVAGYPARATGLLQQESAVSSEIDLLTSVLKADFPGLLRGLVQVWAYRAHVTERHNSDFEISASEQLGIQMSQWVSDQLGSSLGVLCAFFRWGDEERLSKALQKVDALCKLLLHGQDPYLWLLANLTGEATEAYVNSSLRRNVTEIVGHQSDSGRVVLERYVRNCYSTGKSLIWPSQKRGVEKLAERGSFALCTPTGSGKTSVAELAILDSLFGQVASDGIVPMALYLVPSRALASEVESKLSRVLQSVSDQRVKVTGLYGGTDWGPTDPWLTSDEPTVLICTYEKAEALIRFLGPLFLNRLTLVVIDEAHSVQFDGRTESFRTAENRSLRLESLISRLLAYVDEDRTRVIALSAVASGFERPLACWVTRQPSASPVSAGYRSMRQLIGRLECLPNRGFTIRYDMMDGSTLEFQEAGQPDRPYIPSPFNPYAPASKWEKAGPQKRLRPYLLWAGMHLAAPDQGGRQHAVLLAIAQHIGGFAEDFLDLLDHDWSNESLPQFFRPPEDQHRRTIWERCLKSCEDYFGSDSFEYRLLRRGIAVHHGKMPGLLARLLVEAIQERVVYLVLATSTLSEGVNLPFETVIISSLRRGTSFLTVREFANLVGRAGRPGVGTSGQSLVLSPHVDLAGNAKEEWSMQQAQSTYFGLLEGLRPTIEGERGHRGHSPLAELIEYLQRQWHEITGSDSLTEFARWLEETAVLYQPSGALTEPAAALLESLDSLDGILLSALVEAEQRADRDLSAVEVEEHLQGIWQQSYAHYCSSREQELGSLFVRRGRSLASRHYPQRSVRRKFYNTSLPPRSAVQLLDAYASLKEHLSQGWDYVRWDATSRLEYVETTAMLLNSIPVFAQSDRIGNTRVDWHDALAWWLDPIGSTSKPGAKQVSAWHEYISRYFQYRFNWALGSIVALAMDESHGGQPIAPSLTQWPTSNLPWIVFWLKELIVWGTIDPVAAFLLARSKAVTRTEAEEIAVSYYEGRAEISPNELLNPIAVRDWVDAHFAPEHGTGPLGPPQLMKVRLSRDFAGQSKTRWTVVPVEVGPEILWYDPAGFPLATSPKPSRWSDEFLSSYDFVLKSDESLVESRLYLSLKYLPGVSS